MTLSGKIEALRRKRAGDSEAHQNSTFLCVSVPSLQPVSSLCFQHRFLRAVCSPGAKLSRSLAVYSPLDAI